ncbi:MAG: hypothetical protein M1825_003001 [Sarcosagium campestre]|nr:MAG: hypothetical protein M1825_003001 [Sarcosagium campestre]
MPRHRMKPLADDERPSKLLWWLAGGMGKPPTGSQLRERKRRDSLRRERAKEEPAGHNGGWGFTADQKIPSQQKKHQREDQSLKAKKHPKKQMNKLILNDAFMRMEHHHDPSTSHATTTRVYLKS